MSDQVWRGCGRGLTVGAGALLWAAHDATAGLTLAGVEHGESATALVEIMQGRQRAYGTAFCIDPAGLFVTNAHVIDALGGPVKLVLNPGTDQQQDYPAEVWGVDPHRDLAVLRTVQPPGATTRPALTVLTLSKSDAVYPTMNVTAFGYPFGGELAFDPQAYPAVSVNGGHITALRRKRKSLEDIQVDAAVNPGNSGGPLLNDDGDVVGIVEAGVKGAGVNFAIPVQKLQAMLAGPLVAVTPATVLWQHCNDEQHFTARVNWIQHDPAAVYQVKVTLLPGQADPRVYEGATDHGAFAFSAPLLMTHELPVDVVETVGDLPGEQPEGLRLRGVPYTVELSLGSKPIGHGAGTLRLENDTPSVVNARETELPPLPSMAPRPFRPFPGFPRAGAPVPGDPQMGNSVPSDADETDMVGGTGGGPFVRVDPRERPVVGFHYVTGSWMNKGIVCQFDPIYTMPGRSGEGLPAVINSSKTSMGRVIARDGYVVGGLMVDGDQYFNAFNVVFMRYRNGKLVTNDRYDSGWIGDPWSGNVSQLGADGRRVIGLFGRQGLNCDGIGLVMEK